MRLARHPLRTATAPSAHPSSTHFRKSRDGIWWPRGSRNLRPHLLFGPLVDRSRNFTISARTSGSDAASGRRRRRGAPASPRNHQPGGIWVGVVTPPFRKRVVSACDGSRLRLPFTSVWCLACDGSRRFGSGGFSEVCPSMFSGPQAVYFLHDCDHGG